ncbi:MAG TPA: extracellular solute-binding protein [Alphaproteobacteria bacterium]|jgi:ABC-type Fe3+ transport system substrate-binding protein
MRYPNCARAFTAAVSLTIVLSVSAGPSLAQAPDGAQAQAALQALVAQAKKEPDAINGSMTRVLLSTPDLIKQATKMFNQEFGLNKTFNIVEGTDNTFTAQMRASLDMDARPKLSFYTTNASDMQMFISGGYIPQVKDWQLLLAAINPRVQSGEVKPTDISRASFGGYAFAHSNRLKGVGYNTSLASPKDLPQTYAEIADPKYKGQYAIEPWTSHWDALAYNYYPDRLDKFLEIMNAIGKNSYWVAQSHQLIPRMAQGEFKFMTLNAEVIADYISKNPGAPLGYYFMNDMTLLETTMMFVPKQAPSSATGTLWVMFLTRPDVQALRWDDAPNVMYGEKPSDKEMKAKLDGKNVWDWQMNPSTTDYWKWLNSKDAETFRSQRLKAIKQQR